MKHHETPPPDLFKIPASKQISVTDMFHEMPRFLEHYGTKDKSLSLRLTQSLTYRSIIKSTKGLSFDTIHIQQGSTTTWAKAPERIRKGHYVDTL